MEGHIWKRQKMQWTPYKEIWTIYLFRKEKLSNENAARNYILTDIPLIIKYS